MSLTLLSRTLHFLPLGMFWAAVGVAFNHENIANHWLFGDTEPFYWSADQRSIFVIVGPFLYTCLIATLLGRAILKPERSATTWAFNWVVAGVTSTVGGVMASSLVFPLMYSFWPSVWILMKGSSSLYGELSTQISYALVSWLFLSVGSTPIVTQSTVVAISSIPIGLVVRRIVLQGRTLSEPAGGTFQTQL